MDTENTEETDLFGNPWRPLKDQRGRKRHKWSSYVAEKIAVLRATGLNQEQIGDRLGVDPKTLRKYYSRELEEGPSLAKALLDEKMWEKALGGNVSAARYCRESFETGKAKRIAAMPQKSPMPPRLGKKEERRMAAQRVGGLYATPPAPKVQ